MRARLIPAFLFALLAVTANAQGNEGETGWHYLIQPYVLFPNMQGQTGIGALPPVDVDEDPSDIFDNLQFGAMLYAEAHNDRWALTSDFLYMDLESEVLRNSSIADGTAKVSQLGWEIALLARLSPWIEVGVSALYMKIDAELNITLNTALGSVSRRGDLDREWVDPTVLVRAIVPLGDKWFLAGRANVGGYGVSSDFVWQLQGDIGYRFSDRVLMSVGYRALGIDYDRGSGPDRFVYDMTIFGPMLRVGFAFE
jgi:hypothetical protein